MDLINILEKNMGMGDNTIFSILCVLIVFVVIAAIITGIYFASKLIDKSESKNKPAKEDKPVIKQVKKSTNITDDDMMAAVLVATIDYRNEVKKDVRLVSVREVK